MVAHPEILWMLVQPKIKWRLYPFRGDEALPALHIHRSSSYLIGKEKKVSSHVFALRIWSACSGLDLHLNAILTHQSHCMLYVRCATSSWRTRPSRSNTPVRSLCHVFCIRACSLEARLTCAAFCFSALQYRLISDKTSGKAVNKIVPYIIDLGSTNGTFVNKDKIEPKR